MANGKVYSLSQKEIDEHDDRKAVVAQMLTASLLGEILLKARREIDKLEFPLNWPNKFYDKQNTLDMLTDLIPIQSVSDMELEAEVRRLEINAARENGQ